MDFAPLSNILVSFLLAAATTVPLGVQGVSEGKPQVNRFQKHRQLLWALRNLGWTIIQWKRVPQSDESLFQVFLGRNGHRVLRTKEKNHPDCYQQQVRKPGSVMIGGCVCALGKGNLHFCNGTINAEKYIEILEHNMLPSRRNIFQEPYAYFNKTMQNHILHTLQSPGYGERGYRDLTGLPAVPPVSNTERVAHFEEQNVTLKTLYCYKP